MTSLPDAVARVCEELGRPHLTALAERSRSIKAFDTSARHSLEHAVPAPHRAIVRPLLDAWAGEPSLPGDAVALAIESACATVCNLDRPDVSVVCTGPSTPVAPVRLTAQVVLELIDGATERVTVSSFSSYKVPAVMVALDAAIARGVRVDLILESQSNLAYGGGAELFADYHVYVWPDDLRPPDARLHAKAIIIDRRDVLLTSANLSNAAFSSNLELGVVIRGGTTARAVQAHFDALIAAGTLRPVTG